MDVRRFQPSRAAKGIGNDGPRRAAARLTAQFELTNVSD
ncbi:MAG: hypothetical protein JWL98_1719 [Xanthomonadaceae bacterium]|nr:hypothetical protein [Xanthomonadaceae bacterium]